MKTIWRHFIVSDRTEAIQNGGLYIDSFEDDDDDDESDCLGARISGDISRSQEGTNTFELFAFINKCDDEDDEDDDDYGLGYK